MWIFELPWYYFWLDIQKSFTKIKFWYKTICTLAWCKTYGTKYRLLGNKSSANFGKSRFILKVIIKALISKSSQSSIMITLNCVHLNHDSQPDGSTCQNSLATLSHKGWGTCIWRLSVNPIMQQDLSRTPHASKFKEWNFWNKNSFGAG